MSKREQSAVLDEERLTYDVADVRRATGLSRPTIYKAIERGELKAIRLGCRILIPRASLLNLLNGVEAK